MKQLLTLGLICTFAFGACNASNADNPSNSAESHDSTIHEAPDDPTLHGDIPSTTNIDTAALDTADPGSL